MKRNAFAVVDAILTELPEDSELHRVTKHVRDSLIYQAPEVAWTYAATRMAPAFYATEQLSPRPEWFDRVVAIWMGTADVDPRQQALETEFDRAEALLGGDR